MAGVPAQCVRGATPLALDESLDGSAVEILTLPVKSLSHRIPGLEPAWKVDSRFDLTASCSHGNPACPISAPIVLRPSPPSTSNFGFSPSRGVSCPLPFRGGSRFVECGLSACKDLHREPSPKEPFYIVCFCHTEAHSTVKTNSVPPPRRVPHSCGRRS